RYRYRPFVLFRLRHAGSHHLGGVGGCQAWPVTHVILLSLSSRGCTSDRRFVQRWTAADLGGWGCRPHRVPAAVNSGRQRRANTLSGPGNFAGDPMHLIRLYVRVLGLLGPERKLGWILAGANLALAAAQFAEPVLFGKVIDTLAGAQARGQAPLWSDLLTLLGAWVGFGLFTIVCGALVALNADRLSHRRRLAVLTDSFQ